MKRRGQGIGSLEPDARHRAVYVVSAAAQMAGMHPQTLRQYDRLGLVSPKRSRGRGRRYSYSDVEKLRYIQTLSQAGINLEGIRRILLLEDQNAALQAENRILRWRINAGARVFAADSDGEVQVTVQRGSRRN